MAGKRRPRTKAQIEYDQLIRQYKRAGAGLIALEAKRLESPPADADLVGEQTHFLRRIERLPQEAQGLAVRLYYSYELRRFVARDALGVPIAEIGREREPEDLAERRVVVSIEPGPTPARLVFDGRGKVITCLAPDMAVGSGTRVSFEQFEASVRRFGEWRSAHARARDAVTSTDVVCLALDLQHSGWRTPRETLEALDALGPAGGFFIMHELHSVVTPMVLAYAEAQTTGPRDDRRLRRWLDLTGECAAFLTLLARWRVEPDLTLCLQALRAPEPVYSMVIGACLAFWRPDDGHVLLVERMHGDERSCHRHSYRCASVMYLGMVRRMGRAAGWPPDDIDWIDPCLNDSLDSDEAHIAERRRLGLPVDSLHIFLRDLTLLALGRRPDWGDDLADDPDTLPPLLIEDLCLPDNDTSPRAPRILAQRLFAGLDRPLWHLFQPAAALGRWRERLGSLHRVRTGDYIPPWTVPDEKPPPVPLNLPGRNEPCPCGSGKKFKKCCLPKVEAGEDVG